jgi:enoyl-CoA hydratase/carnithine racemase
MTSSNSYQTLDVTRPAGGVLLARLDRLEQLSAITFAMFEELFTVLQAAPVPDPVVRVLVITGAGHCFCAGLDLTSVTLPTMSASEVLAGQVSWAGTIAAFA